MKIQSSVQRVYICITYVKVIPSFLADPCKQRAAVHTHYPTCHHHHIFHMQCIHQQPSLKQLHKPLLELDFIQCLQTQGLLANRFEFHQSVKVMKLTVLNQFAKAMPILCFKISSTMHSDKCDMFAAFMCDSVTTYSLLQKDE